jgi:hypothetical protein
MDLLRKPIRENLPIPWERIKHLDTIGRARVPVQVNASPGPSRPRVPEREKVAPPDISGKDVEGRQSKRRKVDPQQSKGESQPRSSRRNQKKKRVEIDDGADVVVKMEEMHFEVSIIFHSILLANSNIDTKWGYV